MENELLKTINSYIEKNGGRENLANWIIFENEKYFFKGFAHTKARLSLNGKGIYDLDGYNSFCKERLQKKKRRADKLKWQAKRRRLGKPPKRAPFAKQPAWTKEETNTIFDLRLNKNKKWREIAEVLNRSLASCSKQFYNESERMGIILKRGMF